MPTGYTCGVADGEITTFSDFAMGCARAFDALITMRDDPSDAPIPEKFEPSDYHSNAEADAHIRLEVVNEWDGLEAQHETTEAYIGALLRRVASIMDDYARYTRYQRMLTQVWAWTPPTPEHERFKEFMVEQLETSIEHDCLYFPNEPQRLSGPDYKEQEIAKAQRDIDYHAEKHAEEVERTNSRNAWVRALRDSLAVNEADSK